MQGEDLEKKFGHATQSMVQKKQFYFKYYTSVFILDWRFDCFHCVLRNPFNFNQSYLSSVSFILVTSMDILKGIEK